MFGLGVTELVFVFLLALILFGPKRLPEVGKMLGKGMGEFRKASTDLQRALNAEVAVKDEVVQELKETADVISGRAENRPPKGDEDQPADPSESGTIAREKPGPRDP